MRVRWLRRAQRDRYEQIAFIADDNPRAALEAGETIRRATLRLAEFPFMGRVGRVPGTRELPIARTPYLLMYRVYHDEVVILRLMHGAMRWPAK